MKKNIYSHLLSVSYLSKGVCSSLSFLGVSLLASMVLAAALPLKLVSPRLHRACRARCVFLWWNFATHLDKFLGIRFIIEGDALPHGENVILIANHRTMADTAVVAILALNQGRLADIKWIGKETIKYVPGLGLGLLLAGSLFLKRDWARDKAYFTNALLSLRAGCEPFWLVLFPEGTRFAQDKRNVKASPVRPESAALTQVLPPKAGGFVIAVQLLRQRSDAVYDVTILYPSGQRAHFWDYLQGRISEVRIQVVRTPMAELPHDDKALGCWLRERFQHKDRNLTDHYRPK